MSLQGTINTISQDLTKAAQTLAEQSPIVQFGVDLLFPILGPAAAAVGAAANQQAQTQANVGDFNNPQPVQPGVGSTPVGAPSATNEAAIAQERYAEAQTEIGREQQQLGQTVLGEKVSEVTSEGGITASAAARGLKMEGSPLMQLIAQKQLGESTISYTQQQGSAAISGARTGAQASLDAANLSGQMQLQYAAQQMNDAWLMAFQDITSGAEAMLGKFWNPASAASAAPSSSYDPYQYTTGNFT